MSHSDSVIDTLQIRSDTIRKRLIELYKHDFQEYCPSFDDSNHLRHEIQKLSTKLSEVDVTTLEDHTNTTAQTTESFNNATISLAAFHDLVEMHDLLMAFDHLIETGRFVAAACSISTMSHLLVRITTTARGLTAVDTVKLQVSKKRARAHSRLSQLFAASFVVGAEEASVTVTRRHAGVHGHVHYDAPVRIGSLLHSMWYLDRPPHASPDEVATIVPGSFLHEQLVTFARALSHHVLMVATKETYLSPETSNGATWSKVQFVRSAEGGGGSPVLGANPITSVMDVDKVLDRILIVLDVVEVELCPKDAMGAEEEEEEEEEEDKEDKEEEGDHQGQHGTGGEGGLEESARPKARNARLDKRVQQLLGQAALELVGQVLWDPTGPLTTVVLRVLRNALPDDEKNMPVFDRVVDQARRFEHRKNQWLWGYTGGWWLVVGWLVVGGWCCIGWKAVVCVVGGTVHCCCCC